jgi:elongation factor P
MVTAQQLRPGMAIRFEGVNYKVMNCEYHPGQGKMGGVTHARLRNLATGTFREHSLRAELKLDVLPVEKQSMEFIYSDADQCYFMNPVSFEQVGIEIGVVGPAGRFLQPGMQLPVEFIEGQPISVVFPDIVEMRVAVTAPPAHGQQDNTWKTARLDNGLEIMVPQFIKSGDLIRLETETLKYVDRAKVAAR